MDLTEAELMLITRSHDPGLTRRRQKQVLLFGLLAAPGVVLMAMTWENRLGLGLLLGAYVLLTAGEKWAYGHGVLLYKGLIRKLTARVEELETQASPSSDAEAPASPGGEPVQITIETTVAAPLERVWQAWTTPADIEQWNAASDAWCCPGASLDLRPGGSFSYRMEARDGSMGFDFAGTFLEVLPEERLVFTLDDERPVTVVFHAGDEGVTVRETFEAESAEAAEPQRQGWQAILDRFARHVESGGGA